MDRSKLFPSYAPPNLRFSHGQGTWLIDTAGRRYLDFISGISVNTLGHAHPDLVAALDALCHVAALSKEFPHAGREVLVPVPDKGELSTQVQFRRGQWGQAATPKGVAQRQA